jgi:hypothetical protein
LILLDHNIPKSQSQELESSRIRFKQIGVHIDRPEWDDQQEILRYLHGLRDATFFTRDLGFYRPSLRHRDYCIVVIDNVVTATAGTIVRFLRHPLFKTKALRSGLVAKASTAKLHIWAVHKEKPYSVRWNGGKSRPRKAVDA